MHRRALLTSAAAVALAACTSPQVSESGAALSPDAATPAGDFDVALYRALAAAPGNQFVSPYSVSTAFALVYPGAR